LFKPEIQIKQNVEGIDKPEFYDFIQTQKPAAKFVTGYSVRWIYLSLAALLILATYLPNLLSLRAGKRLVR
jgi:mxaL protein